MGAAERFKRFAAECELMAKVTPSPENRAVWRQMAERWHRIVGTPRLIGRGCRLNKASSETCTQSSPLAEPAFNLSSRSGTGSARAISITLYWAAFTELRAIPVLAPLVEVALA
jgi:hypothetical protein